VEDEINYTGNDIGTNYTGNYTILDCIQLCAGVDDCVGAVISDLDKTTRKCWLKTIMDSPTTAAINQQSMKLDCCKLKKCGVSISMESNFSKSPFFSRRSGWVFAVGFLLWHAASELYQCHKCLGLFAILQKFHLLHWSLVRPADPSMLFFYRNSNQRYQPLIFIHGFGANRML
jgi:hypothetical protein